MKTDLERPVSKRDVGPGGLLRALGGPRRELLLGSVVAIVSMVFIAHFARHFWFRYDNFLLVADRRIGSLDDWFRPHNDHWLTWTVLFSRGLHGLFGMNYWPWWYFPRLVGHAAVAFLFWRTLIRRGADPVIAFGTYVVLLVLAVSYFQDALTVANYVVFPCIVVVALLVNGVEVPRSRHLIAAGICLVAAIMANGYGAPLLLAVAVVVTVRHRFRRWSPAIVPPVVILAAWYLRYRSQLLHHDHSLSVGFFVDAIDSAIGVVRTAVENTLGLPGPLAVLVVAAIAGQLVWLTYRRRLDMFDAIIVLTLAAVLGTLAWARTTDPAYRQGNLTRYGYAVVLLLVLVVVPRLRFPTRPFARTAVGLVLVAVVAFNAVSLGGRLQHTGRVSQSIREDAETTAALIAAGEPYSYTPLGVQPRLMQRLVDSGWRPQPSTDPNVVNRARAQMRGVTMGDRSSPAKVAGHTAPAASDVDDNGCLVLRSPSVVELQVTGAGTFKVNRRVVVTWTDLRGTDRRLVQPGVIGLARPVGKTTVSVDTFEGDPTNICSLVPVALPRP